MQIPNLWKLFACCTSKRKGSNSTLSNESYAELMTPHYPNAEDSDQLTLNDFLEIDLADLVPYNQKALDYDISRYGSSRTPPTMIPSPKHPVSRKTPRKVAPAISKTLPEIAATDEATTENASAKDVKESTTTTTAPTLPETPSIRVIPPQMLAQPLPKRTGDDRTSLPSQAHSQANKPSFSLNRSSAISRRPGSSGSKRSSTSSKETKNARSSYMALAPETGE